MRVLISGLGLCLLLLSACSGGAPYKSKSAPTGSAFHTSHASGRYLAQPVQCVPFARERSGISLYGDAHTWWGKAAGRYAQGYLPQPGAVMVLARTDRMRHGHVAVVKRVINSREIEVSHSNWGADFDSRRMAYDTMRVQDASAANDWSSVRLWNYHIGSYGLPYAVSGFIYPRPAG